jgi:hypothetical protein
MGFGEMVVQFPSTLKKLTLQSKMLEARVGFEPTDGGFADLSLRPLGYRAEFKEYSETAIRLSVANTTSEFARLYCNRFN